MYRLIKSISSLEIPTVSPCFFFPTDQCSGCKSGRKNSKSIRYFITCSISFSYSSSFAYFTFRTQTSVVGLCWQYIPATWPNQPTFHTYVHAYELYIFMCIFEFKWLNCRVPRRKMNGPEQTDGTEQNRTEQSERRDWVCRAICRNMKITFNVKRQTGKRWRGKRGEVEFFTLPSR